MLASQRYFLPTSAFSLDTHKTRSTIGLVFTAMIVPAILKP
jgi:hypothetical protein